MDRGFQEVWLLPFGNKQKENDMTYKLNKPRNFVAKYAPQFCKSVKMADKRKKQAAKFIRNKALTDAF